jgi:hypothetical protein
MLAVLAGLSGFEVALTGVVFATLVFRVAAALPLPEWFD